MIDKLKSYFRYICTFIIFLAFLSFTATLASAEVIPHVSVYADSYTFDSNSHSFSIRVSFTANITSQNKEVYVDLMNDNLSDISVTDIDVEYQRLHIYLPPNTSSNQRTIEISGKGSGSGTVIITQAGIAPPPEPEAPVLQQEKLPISGNWKLVRTYTSNAGDRYEDITFYNGLGYPEQIINIGASSTNRRNVVTPVVYDAHMRSDAKVYLPYESTANNTAVRESSLSHPRAPFTQPYMDPTMPAMPTRRTFMNPLRSTARLPNGSAARHTGMQTGKP